MFEIEQISGVPNFDIRNGLKPFVICDHISAGTMDSMTNWFQSSKAQASSHFAIGRNGKIVQYLPIEQRAWTQGIMPDGVQYATAQVVKDMNCNPNAYCVSIEHEGYEGNGLDGNLTDEQFKATCWLHRYIMDYCNTKFNVNMNLSEYNVIGHFQVDPRRKPFCPGVNFPWEKLRKELAIAQTMSLKDYEMRLQKNETPQARKERAFAVVNQFSYMYSLIGKDEGTEAWALNNFDAVYEVLKEKNLL